MPKSTNQVHQENRSDANVSLPTKISTIDQFWSGFQSGVDQAAMRFALSQGKEIMGWVPSGRRAEVSLPNDEYQDIDDGIPTDLMKHSKLIETHPENISNYQSAHNCTEATQRHISLVIEKARENGKRPEIRTELLVASTDATLVLTTGHSSLRDGTLLMSQFANTYQKPVLEVLLNEHGVADASALVTIKNWLERVSPTTLNIGGPRESHSKVVGYSIFNAAARAMAQIFGE